MKPSAAFAAVLVTAISVASASELAKSPEADSEGFIWHAPAEWGLEGQGWNPDDLKSRFDRLPAKAEGVVRDAVWNLSRHSSGISFRFNTDATTWKIRYKVGSSTLGKTNMPPMGVSGVDIYALDGGTWKWVDTTKPTKVETTHTIADIDPGERTYLLYLPLYNTTVDIEIGIPSDAKFEAVASREDKPIVFYGTSITHGASASRPGMTHPAILGRRLDFPIVNLGLSGNGKMEPEVGALLTEIDAAVYVIDCLPNMVGTEVAERTEPLVRQLREARPEVPIVLVEDRTYANAWIFPAKRKRHQESRTALVAAYDNLVSSGVTDLYYLEGDGLLGDDTEGTIDSSHPNDLGFMRQADAFEPVLKKALGLP